MDNEVVNQGENDKNEKNHNPQKEREIGFIFFLLFLFLLIPLGNRYYKAYLDKYTEYREKQAEELQCKHDIEKLNKQLKELYDAEAFLNTPEGVERVARDKLGLTKPQEIPFIVRDEELKNSEEKGKKQEKEKKDIEEQASQKLEWDN